MWSWSSVLVSTDGGGISPGNTIYADIIGISQTDNSVLPSVLFGSDCIGTTTANIGTVDIFGYGLRDCIGISTPSSICDVGNGLTIVKNGVEYSNTNVIEITGDLTLSGNYSKAVIGENMPYATRVDFIDSTTMYKGEAVVGTLDSGSTWRISKYVFGVDSDVTITWASGNDNFDKVWNDRVSLSYS